MDLVDALPKAELHLHIEGTLEPELMFQLAKRNGVLGTLPYQTVEDVRRAYDFKDLQSFLDLYYTGCSVLKTEQDFFDLAWAYMQRADANGLAHVEIFFDAQMHEERGVALDTVVKGLHSALQEAETKFGITGNLIISFVRHKGAEEALQCLERALKYKDVLVGVGLDSTEIGFPNELFTKVFQRAEAEGFRICVHAGDWSAGWQPAVMTNVVRDAGEEGDAENVRQALDDLKAERIDHGIRSLEDPKIMQQLAKKQTALTCCPLSNLKLKIYHGELEDRLRELIASPLRITINSDDPAYFGGYMRDNWQYLLQVVDLTPQQIFDLHANSFKAAFLSEEDRDKHLMQLRAAYDEHVGKLKA